MTRLCTTFVAAGTLALALFNAGAAAQATRTFEHDHPDIVVHPDVAVTGSGSRHYLGGLDVADRSGGVSTTPDNQVLVELAPEDTGPANLFDLNGRTLIFTPDGHGGYSRSVQAVAWADDIGRAVADGEEIQLQSFMFDFAGQRWGSFFVSRHGLITFGEPPTNSYPANWFNRMSEIANSFVTAPTISALYKPMLGGQWDAYGAAQLVAQRPDSVIITWITSDPSAYEHGVPPEQSARFQMVLGADGSIRFHYAHAPFGDGIVGLFPNEEVARGDLIAGVADPRNPELPGHLDLLDFAIYESTRTNVIFELRTREHHRAGQFYRLHFDADEPYWSHDDDLDWSWGIDVEADSNSIWSSGPTTPSLLAIDGQSLTLLADIGNGLSASVSAGVGPMDGEWRQSDTTTATPIQLTERPRTDLSRPRRTVGAFQSEVFHYGSLADLDLIVCRVIDALGDEFDQFIFHGEFRVDAQNGGTPWRRYGANVDVAGLGSAGDRVAPCGSTRLKGRWELPVWVRGDSVLNKVPHSREGPYDRGLLLFAHEFMHAWTAHGWFYLRDGERRPLFDEACQCHWRWDLHVPAAFPWRSDEPGPRSLMGGTYWRENGDGTFTPLDGYWGGGHSWLDLYAVGLADANEVPDMFILRNLRPVNEGTRGGPHTGDKEVILIEQVVAAQGPRVPSARDAQKDFNAGFVYLLEPGQTPDPDMLRLHADYRDKVVEHWSHITGGRSQMTTRVPGVANRSPVAVGTLPDATLHVDGRGTIDVMGAFRDPDGDALTYVAESSAETIATARARGSTVTVTPVVAGVATITVTAMDIAGNTAAQRFMACVGPNGLPPTEYQRYLDTWEAGGSRGSGCNGTPTLTFTDHPIRPGTTPIRAIHFLELREHIAALRGRVDLQPVQWTDPTLTAGVIPVRSAHLMELRGALDEAYDGAGRSRPRWTDPMLTAGKTPIKAVHIMKLRAAVTALEAGLPALSGAPMPLVQD